MLSRAAFDALIVVDFSSEHRTFYLTDVWLKEHGGHDVHAANHTIHYPRRLALIDHIYVTSDALSTISNCAKRRVSFSDHECLQFQLTVPLPNRREQCKTVKVWKLNCSVLSEPEYREKIVFFLANARTLKTYTTDIRTWWDEPLKQVSVK